MTIRRHEWRGRRIGLLTALTASMMAVPWAQACLSDADCTPANPQQCIRYWCAIHGSPGTINCMSEARDFGPCDDGNVCTINESCVGGVCQFGTWRDCGDGDGCTTDACLPPTGCVHSPVNCNDNDPCTNDSCNQVQGCVHVGCNDGDSCTIDSCDASLGCQHACAAGCVPTGEVPLIAVGSNKYTLSWSQATGGTVSAYTYDLARGRTDQFPVGTGGAEACVVSQHPFRIRSDMTLPPAGVGFWYDVRSHHLCGMGPYGMQSNGLARTTSACP